MRKERVLIRVQKTSYDCQSCGRGFESALSFASKGKQMTKTLLAYVVASYGDIPFVAEVAREISLSASSIFRIIHCLSIERKKLSRVFSIDEFKARDSGHSKYQTSLGDGENWQHIDILPSWYLKDLIEYFRKYTEVRERKWKLL